MTTTDDRMDTMAKSMRETAARGYYAALDYRDQAAVELMKRETNLRRAQENLDYWMAVEAEAEVLDLIARRRLATPDQGNSEGENPEEEQ